MPHTGAVLRKYVIAVSLLPTLGLAQTEVTSISDWLAQGRWSIDTRYRVEHVDQDGFDENALASTLRFQGGFETARLNGFSAFAELELVRSIGSEQFNSTTNGLVDYPVVADPETSEINQAYVYYRRARNHIIAGRQILPIKQERFLGSVDFRQNQQTFDALMIMNQSVPGLTLVYGYMDGVRRFLSDDNPVGDVDMNSHILNAEYVTTSEDRLTVYAHLLDMQTPVLSARSHRNIGIRYEGSAGPESLRWLYHLEYADQSSYADGAETIDADYWRAEIGPRFNNQWVLRLGIEQLSGNGVYAFQTPFATGHGFNGRADVFAGGTPAAGLRDRYLKLELPAGGSRLALAYHQFDSDAGGIDYGSEIDVVFSRRFDKRFLVAFEYAQYQSRGFGSDKRNVSLSIRYEL